MAEKTLQIKIASGLPVEVKAAEAEGVALHITGYAAAFGNVDSWGDVIEAGAFKDFLAGENAARCRLCYQHNQGEVIGRITEMREDEKGLYFEADIIDTTTGTDVAKLLKSGAIDEFSIGYYADEYSFEKRSGYDFDIRILTKCTVVEISPVTRAANPKAVLLDAKDAEGTARALHTLSDEELDQMHKALDAEITARAFGMAAAAADTNND